MIKLPVQNKRIPERNCVGCGNQFPKNQLIRVVKTQSGEVFLDTTGKLSGRGAYICRNSECFKKARKAKKLERSLSVTISDEIYDKLEGQVAECEN